MAKKNDTFTPSGWNGEDPKPGNQFDENKSSYPNGMDNNVGNGNRSSRAFADYEDATKMSQFNVINSTDADYAGNSANVLTRTTVDVGRANRGKDY